MFDAFKFPILNIFLSFIPATRLFELKRILLRCFGVEVGEGTRIAGNVRFYGRGGIRIGNNCWIGIGTVFIVNQSAPISIGNCCDIAPEVLFHTGTHSIGSSTRRAGDGFSREIVVGDGCWIGTRSTLLAGVCIPIGCVVGAGAVVLPRHYSENSLLAGVPATLQRDLG